MPLVDFDPEEKVGSPFDFPKLKLERGERARVAILQKQPLAEYVHTLRAPEIINGQAVIEDVRQGDDTVRRMKMQFIGRAICRGDYDTLRDKGIDPAHCPACKASVDNSDAVPPPERRFAVHVIRYAIKSGSFEVTEPYQVQVVAWNFTQRTFDKLITLLDEQEPKNLMVHDLLLGPCENANFQKFDIQMSAKAAWIETEQRKSYTATAWKNNQSPYLDQFLGRRSTPEQMTEDVQRVLMRYAQAQGVAGKPAESVSTEDVDSLLTEMEASPPEQAADEVPVTAPVEDLLKVETPAPATDGKAEDVQSFEELLGEIEKT
jgi:hypothetical protein